jgi:DNA-binding GntR family transcriptional regulator
MKIEHRTLNDRAYDELKKGLIAGEFRPGQVLVIRTLAETYGISTTPVREALQRLVAERLLEMQPNRSIAVPFLSVEKFVELVRIRTALEGLAGELATANIKKVHVQRLDKLRADAAQAIALGDGRAYVAINQKFHFLIYENAGSPQLLRIIQDLWSQVGPFLNRLFDDENYVGHANDEHDKITLALGAGDANAVRQHLVDDITIAARSLTPRLRQVMSENALESARSHVETRRERPPA